jgi:preprotein translocase subunit SecY
MILSTIAFVYAPLALVPIIMIMLLVAIIPMIFFILTLQKALNRCSPENRAMPPENVWLLLIPLFNLVWMFIVVNNMARSLAQEFKKREMTIEEIEPGKSIGLAYCILAVCSVIPFLGILSGLAAFVCWIMYWVKIDGYSSRLLYQELPPAR